ncbi:low temperature requirement protein A [Nocardia suismassiliense]|uniref:low temperature requirement protein A n=1 Tax=Nocardia suismassiliense TaxID=2077092 RepID=UPI002D77B0A2|nr:low temperature requirement protein A [Nocardia suismassiliense]
MIVLGGTGLADTGEFVIRASHFCERHGLVVIVAIGESIVAIGAGLAGVKITPQLIVTMLSGGVALYFLGQFFFRLVLKLPRPWIRLVAAAAVAATTPIGVVWVSWAQLAALVAVGYLAVIADDLITLRSGQHSSYL